MIKQWLLWRQGQVKAEITNINNGCCKKTFSNQWWSQWPISSWTCWLTQLILKTGGGCVLLSCLKMFFFAWCVFCISFLLFVPPLNISLSHPGCRNGTRSHPPATLHIRLSPWRLLCNATLQHHFVVLLFCFIVLDWILACKPTCQLCFSCFPKSIPP